MPEHDLTPRELSALVDRVFQPRPTDRALAILVDLPDDTVTDHPDWRRRRRMAVQWLERLLAARHEPVDQVSLWAYRNVGSNNADLPTMVWRIEPPGIPDHADELDPSAASPLEQVLAQHPLVMAPTEFSTTAPLKVLAPRIGFRAATMPGFSSAMLPALRLDYVEIDRRVRRLKELLDESTRADLVFTLDKSKRLDLRLDLRHRLAHASGGLIRERGTAGNLPSGEAYIVPYEGEIEGVPSTSEGLLPIQIGTEVVIHRVSANRVVGVVSEGPISRREGERLLLEPAAGNVAELGLGVLHDFGIQPIGEVLLDEKLGLHIALGRSEHFGGQVGPDDFSRPEAVVHQDHVYLHQLQPRIDVASARLTMAEGSSLELIADGDYVIDFDAKGPR